MYYRITVRDNGCGMKHEQIPDFLGRVLAGSKCAEIAPRSRRDRSRTNGFVGAGGCARAPARR